LITYLKLWGAIGYWLTAAPFRGHLPRLGAAVHQMVRIGVEAVPMAALTSLSIGLVLAMQGATILDSMGAQFFVPDLVAASLVKELAPLVIGIIIVGRSGSAITAQLGTMRVSEEIDALDIMAIDPVAYLVVPRFLALLVMAPVLTVFGVYVGLFGGWLICSGSLDMGLGYYGMRALGALALKDVVAGMVKSVVFAALIATIACHYGLGVLGGAEGVGRATTSSVVVSLTALFIANAVLTALFFID
jgi:phospholipid/cholesterol/gamma-HCH transport system permease protein